VEDGIHYLRKIIQTNHDILWTNELTGNIPDYDE